MDFNEEKPIWRQIYDLVCTRILSDEWTEHGRIVSVRELAAEVGVNPNTVMRSYERLESDKIIYNRRGIGFFIAAGAKQHILEIERQEFLTEELPAMMRRMRLLDIDIEQIETEWKRFIAEEKKDDATERK